MLSAAGMIASPANADSNFVGHWSQTASERHCSVALGFQLKADGAASVDWALQGSEGGANFRSVVGRRDGKWTSNGNALHLVIIDVVSDQAVLKRLGRTTPLSTEIDVDGSIVGDNRLESLITDSRDRNIDGQPYRIRCIYLRD